MAAHYHGAVRAALGIGEDVRGLYLLVFAIATAPVGECLPDG
jgi:hypothetical protein